jgi:DNA-binding response OmpR family regulator
MHALIIEDNVLITAMISDQLRDRGFSSVECAMSCAEAIALASANCPDLITADHRLAGESGIDVVRKICEIRPIPVIYIVALPNEVLDEEPDAVIVQKPFTIAELRRAIVEVMPSSFRSGAGDASAGLSPSV